MRGPVRISSVVCRRECSPPRVRPDEQFHHPEFTARVLQLAGPPPVIPDAGFGTFLLDFMPDRDSAERFADNRLAHMDRVGIDVQVVSHGANSPVGRRALSLLRTRPRLARGGWHPRPAAELLGSTGSSPEPE